MSNYMIAEDYFLLGDTDQGFVYLNRAYEKKATAMRIIKVGPYFDEIRDDPRYKEILKKMNLE